MWDNSFLLSLISFFSFSFLFICLCHYLNLFPSPRRVVFTSLSFSLSYFLFKFEGQGTWKEIPPCRKLRDNWTLLIICLGPAGKHLHTNICTGQIRQQFIIALKTWMIGECLKRDYPKHKCSSPHYRDIVSRDYWILMAANNFNG